MKNKFFILLVLAITSVTAKPISKVYVNVNGEDITSNDIAIALKNPRINFDTLTKEQKDGILKQLVDKKLLAQKALKSDVTKDKTYKETLKSTIKNIKGELALQIWIKNLTEGIDISEKKMKNYYNKHKDEFSKPEEFKAKHILVKTKKEAQSIIKKLKKSKSLKADFAKLAKEKSTGPSGKNGGDLGWFNPKQMVPEFSKAVSKLKKNSITKTPVKTQFGFHIIYLEDKHSKNISSFKESKNKIKSILGQKIFKDKLTKMISQERAKAKIIYK